MRRSCSTLFLLALMACTSTAPTAGTAPSSDGVKIWYRSEGSGSPVVVIHGGPGMDHNSLAADLAPLARNHRVIYYDQRGGGRSSLPADPAVLTIEHHVADLEALRSHLGLERLTILAHSFGPAIAARYAIAHPDRVERMIFLGPIPPRKTTFFEDYGRELGSRLTAEQLKRLEELNAAYESSSDAVAICREVWKIGIPPRLASGMPVSVVKSDLCTAPSEGIRYGMTKTNPATFSSLGDWNWIEELKGVTAPTLIIHGDEDAIPLALVREWSSLPESRFLILPKTGHFPHAERPDIVFPAVESFLGGSWPADSVKER